MLERRVRFSSYRRSIAIKLSEEPETKGSSLVNQKHAVANGGLHGYNGFGEHELDGNH
jgi:hypothetical protein